MRESQKLTPVKGGLFASCFAKAGMDFDTSTPNTAGEMMEDMFRAGADAAIHDVDEGYADEAFVGELQEYAAQEPQIDPELLAESELMRQQREIAQEAAKEMDSEEDNEIAFEEKNGRGRKARPTAAGRASKKATAEPNLRPFKPFRATSTIANTKAKMNKATPAIVLPTRTSTRTTKSQPATRPATKNAGKGKAKAKAAAPTTTRTATSRNKPTLTQVAKMSDKQLRGHIGGRSVRLRNWKGDVIKPDDGKGIVVVYLSEADPAEYERFDS